MLHKLNIGADVAERDTERIHYAENQSDVTGLVQPKAV